MTATQAATPQSVLLVGFDSAWTPGNRGAIVAVLMRADGTLHELGDPRSVNFNEASTVIDAWQAQYNPQRRKSFSRDDWRFLCARVREELASQGLAGLAGWVEQASTLVAPRKHDQDGLDTILCLLVALYLARGRDCLMVGDLDSGYIVVPHRDALFAELEARCRNTGRDPAKWLQRISRIPAGFVDTPRCV